MKLYLGLAGPLLLYVYLPLAIVVLLLLMRKLKSWKARAFVLPFYLIAAYAIPLGDVTYHSLNMAKACTKAGLHVYRTVVVDGFLGEYASADALRQHPYVFLENRPFSSDPDVVRFERSGDQIINTTRPAPTAEWEIVKEPFDHPDKSLGVTVDGHVIRNLRTGEVIAEYFVFSAWRGWIDAWISSVIENSAGVCYTRPKMSEKFHEILVPSGATK